MFKKLWISSINGAKLKFINLHIIWLTNIVSFNSLINFFYKNCIIRIKNQILYALCLTPQNSLYFSLMLISEYNKTNIGIKFVLNQSENTKSKTNTKVNYKIG